MPRVPHRYSQELMHTLAPSGDALRTLGGGTGAGGGCDGQAGAAGASMFTGATLPSGTAAAASIDDSFGDNASVSSTAAS